MSGQIQHFYEFGAFRIDAVKRLLLRDGETVSLTPKAFETLLALIQNSGRVIDKDELMQMVWPDTIVEENNLAQNISVLRKALGESLTEHSYIVTVPGSGYRFVANVRESGDANGDLAVERPPLLEATTKEQHEASVPNEVWVSPDGTTSGRDNGRAIMETANERTTRVEELGAVRVTSSTRHFINDKYRNRVVALAIVALAIAIAAIAIGLFKFIGWRQRQTESAGSFKVVEVARLTNSGKSRVATISPDGKYLAYVADDAGQESLWIRQMATNSSVQIVPPTEALLESLAFSHDGNYVYYGQVEDELPFLANHVVYQVPVLGGVSKKVISHVGSPISFSPDGKQFAFVRSYSSQETALIIANADGAGEQKLTTRTKPDFFYGDYYTWYTGPAWSPDGKIIACAVGSSGTDGLSMTVVEVRVEDGSERPMTSQKWKMAFGLTWLSDGSGLLVNASELAEKLIGGTRNSQIWHLTYPSGEARRISSGTNEYRGISVTADSSAIVTVQHNDLMNVWIAPNGDASRAKQITFGASKYFGVSWTRDGRIVYSSRASGNPEIWIMDADGSNQKQLTDYARDSGQASVSPDGRYIVFQSARSVWRMNLDGSDPRKLTGGLGENFARCSPDGKWVVYLNSKDSTLWKVSIDGGEPVQLTFKPDASFPDISPDGKLIAFYYEDAQANPSRGIGIIPFSGGRPIKRWSIPPSARMPTSSAFFTRWTPDGQGVAYIDTRGGVSNILVQPLAGGPSKQLTEFKSDLILQFGWSGDGAQLAVVRGMETDDVVQIRVSR
jgi:Tol biopolymer transport system component/DNA-binding winged helix-turn-helix (wHTH) protein